MPRPIVIALVGSLLFGATLAASFHFGVTQLSEVAFFGLFLCALLFPVYRAEYGLGLIVGMTPVFGSAIPFFLALAFAALSFVARRLGGLVVALVRKG